MKDDFDILFLGITFDEINRDKDRLKNVGQFIERHFDLTDEASNEFFNKYMYSRRFSTEETFKP